MAARAPGAPGCGAAPQAAPRRQQRSLCRAPAPAGPSSSGGGLPPTGRPRRRGGRGRSLGASSIQLVAVPGPLFISEGFDRDRLRDSKTSLQPSTFLQFPVREDAAELRRTPPLVR